MAQIPNMHGAAAAVLASFVLLAIAGSAVMPAYSQDEDIPTCSLTQFDPNCSPSGWIAFILGEVFVAIAIAVFLFYLQSKTDKGLSETIEQIQVILKREDESRRRQLIYVNQALKNYFSVILMITGLMNRALVKAETYEDVPATIRDKQKDLVRAVNRSGEALSLAVEMLDPLLTEQIRRFLNRVEEVNLSSGVGKGFPGYDDLKKEIARFTEKLDAEIGNEDRILK